MNKNVVVIDGQGGRLGQMLVEEIIKAKLPCELAAIGTNSIATAMMLKAGAPRGATGENPVVVACRNADVILGPIGIIAADSLLGEVTPTMATAVGQSAAVKLLLPVSQCNNQVIGIAPMTMSEMVTRAVERLKEYL